MDLNSTISGSDDTSFNIKFICPTCNSEKLIAISRAEILKKQSLTAIAIPKNFMCPHSFSAFVDRNGKIRGYQKYDLEIVSYKDYEEENTQKHNHVESSKTILKLKIHLGEEIFLRCIKSVLNNIPICCITNNVIIKEYLRNFLFKIFGDNTPPLFITSLEEYNQELRFQFQDKDDIFIFNTNLCAVIKEPFKKGLNEKDFELEHYIINSVDFNNLNDTLILETLITTISKLFDVLDEIKNHVEEGKIKKKEQILQILRNVTGTKFKNKNLLDNIILNRYNLDINRKLLNGFFGAL